VVRITPLPGSDPTSLLVEGRLVGPWVAVLETELGRAEALRRPIVLDLSGVKFADVDAVRVLARAAQRGVTLSGCSPLLASLLEGTRG
jgi:anti-anti-sigma regulatory factor